MKTEKKITIIAIIILTIGIFYLSFNRYILKILYPQKIIHVKIVNGVKKTGIYKIKEGETMAKLIELAGGLVEHYSLSEMELARKLEDSDVISIGVGNGRE